MAIKGTQNTSIEYSKKVGYGEFKIIKFNPTREELNEMLGIEAKDGQTEIKYTSIDNDGYEKVTISVWGEHTRTKEKKNLRFTIVNKEVIGKNSGKYQYINNVGETGWALDESDLQKWFTNFLDKDKKVIGEKSYRKALVGEGNFYAFLRCWFNLNLYSPDSELQVDMNRMFNGDFDELNKYISTDIVQTVVWMNTIRTVEDNDEVKEYETVFNGAFLPGKLIKGLRLNSDNKLIAKFKENISGEYGCTDYYVMEEMRDYVAGENLAATNSTKDISSDDDSY